MNARWCAVILLTALPAVCQQFGPERIGDIEFFGYMGIDTDAVRQSLPIHVNDTISDRAQAKEKIRMAVRKVLGRDPTGVTLVCCREGGDSVLFIGLRGASYKPFSYDAAPKGTARLSSELVNLNRRRDQALMAAVRKGNSGEDHSKGYALRNDPAARALDLEMRDYALHHESELLKVLKSCPDGEQRQIAAEALGYARQSPQQIKALVRAARDADSDVRNNATRALGVLVDSNADLAKRIPAESFIGMLSSGIWEDRNKGGALLMYLTRERNPRLLARLRAAAFDSLLEMAEWQDTSHAYFSRVILGRIAGLPENRLQELAAKGTLQPILGALNPH